MKNQKKRKQNQQILYGGNASFTPLVFTTNSGMSKEIKQFHRQLCQLLCEKSGVCYSEFAWVKQQIIVSLLGTSIICIKCSRSKKYIISTKERMDIHTTNHVVGVKQK